MQLDALAGAKWPPQRPTGAEEQSRVGVNEPAPSQRFDVRWAPKLEAGAAQAYWDNSVQSVGMPGYVKRVQWEELCYKKGPNGLVSLMWIRARGATKDDVEALCRNFTFASSRLRSHGKLSLEEHAPWPFKVLDPTERNAQSKRRKLSRAGISSPTQ